MLICDEAVSALDVSVQAQVLKLLEEIQSKLNLAILFITHDLRVAAQICDRVLVMQSGIVVEEGLTGTCSSRRSTTTPGACSPVRQGASSASRGGVERNGSDSHHAGAALSCCADHPGPNLLLLTHTAASASRRAALGVALGISTGTVMWVAVAVFGVQQIFEAAPALQTALRAVGGVYLLYLAWGLFGSVRQRAR